MDVKENTAPKSCTLALRFHLPASAQTLLRLRQGLEESRENRKGCGYPG